MDGPRTRWPGRCSLLVACPPVPRSTGGVVSPSYDGLKRQRLTTPYVKNANGTLEATSWEEALETVAAKLHATPAGGVQAVAGRFADVEGMVSLRDLLHRHGSEGLFTEEAFPVAGAGSDVRANYIMNSGIENLEDADLVVFVGTNPRYEAPLVNARVRKGWVHNETRVAVLGEDVDLTYDHEHLGGCGACSVSLSSPCAVAVRVLVAQAAPNPLSTGPLTGGFLVWFPSISFLVQATRWPT